MSSKIKPAVLKPSSLLRLFEHQAFFDSQAKTNDKYPQTSEVRYHRYCPRPLRGVHILILFKDCPPFGVEYPNLQLNATEI